MNSKKCNSQSHPWLIQAIKVVVLSSTLTIATAIYRPLVNAEVIFQSSIQPNQKIENESGESEKQLASYLTQIGAKMYGAWWCPHCHEQKELFGRQAWPSITYIECYDAGSNYQVKLCRDAGITGYPTWKINDQTLVGRQSLEDLADAAGYTGPRDFHNKI